MCCFTKPLTWGERGYVPLSINKPTRENNPLQWDHLEESRHQLPFLFQFAHRLGELLLGALVPELPHLQGQTISQGSTCFLQGQTISSEIKLQGVFFFMYYSPISKIKLCLCNFRSVLKSPSLLLLDILSNLTRAQIFDCNEMIAQE